MSFVKADTGWVIGVSKEQDSPASISLNTTYILLVWQTTDGGRHWQRKFAREYAKGEGPIGSVGIDFVNAATGWFLTSNMATWQGDLYYTNDGGKDWQKVNQIKCTRPYPAGLNFITPKIGWIPLDVGAGPISGGLMYTSDGGKNFSLIESSSNYSEMDNAHEVNFISPQLGWAVRTFPNQGDYLIRTTDGGQTWTQVYPELRPTQDMSFVDSQIGFGLGELADAGALLYTRDGGETWRKIYSFSRHYRPGMISFVNKRLGWVLARPADSTTEQKIILQTTDGGKSWAQIKGDIPSIQDFVTQDFRFFDAENGIIATHITGSVFIYRTKDGGKTWEEWIQGRSRNSICQISFRSLSEGWEISQMGTGRNAVEINEISEGTTWQDRGQISTNAWPYGMDVISRDEGYILLQEQVFQPGSRLELLITRDGGRTWTANLFPDGLQLGMQNDRMPIQFTDDHHGWILSTQGLLRTQNGGKTWSWG